MKAKGTELKKVKSSHIDSVSYDDSSRVLTVKFNSGHVYEYSGVPSSTYMCLNLAASKGQYFDTHIKGKYPTKKVK